MCCPQTQRGSAEHMMEKRAVQTRDWLVQPACKWRHAPQTARLVADTAEGLGSGAAHWLLEQDPDGVVIRRTSRHRVQPPRLQWCVHGRNVWRDTIPGQVSLSDPSHPFSLFCSKFFFGVVCQSRLAWGAQQACHCHAFNLAAPTTLPMLPCYRFPIEWPSELDWVALVAVSPA